MNKRTEVVKSEEVKTLLEELFEGFNGNPEDYKAEVDWGAPVGNEVNI